MIFWIFVVSGGIKESTFEDFIDGWNERNIYVTYGISSLDTLAGSIEFVNKFDFNNDGWIDMVVSNKPDVNNGDFVYIYLGGPDGYNSTRYLRYRTDNGAEVEGADLNRDGFTELIVSHYYAPGHFQNRGAIIIYWGTENGPSDVDTTMLLVAQQTEAVFVADLNRDGFLDIIGGDYTPDGNISEDDNFIIFWGSKNGYSTDNFLLLPAKVARHHFEVADFDKDGYYDILVINYFGGKEYIYWGSENGFSANNILELDYISNTGYVENPHGCIVADFDMNGWLDIVFTGTGGSFTSAYIYYGLGPRQFGNRKIINPGQCFGGGEALHFNSDQYLDLIFYRGSAQDSSDKWKPVVYIGGSNGFNDDSTIEIGSREYNMSGGFITDFNKDGVDDIFVHSWNLFDSSGVLWGPDFYEHTQLWCNIDHHSTFKEIGDIYNRNKQETYTSSILDAGDTVNWDLISWIDSCPGASKIEVDVRTGNTPNPDSTWSGWINVPKFGTVPDINGTDTLISRYIQYRAHLDYLYFADVPYLYEIEILYGPDLMIFPDQIDSVYPGGEVVYNLFLVSLSASYDLVNFRTFHSQSNWDAYFSDSTGVLLTDSNNDGLVDLDSVPPDSVPVSLRLSVRAPDDAMVGDVDTAIIWAYSTNNSTIMDSCVIITVVKQVPQIRVWPDQYDSTMAGVPISYTLYVANNGNGDDVIDIDTVIEHDNWTYHIYDDGNDLNDTDADGIADIGALKGPQGLDTLTVTVLPPADVVEGTMDRVVLKGLSSINTTVEDSAVLITKVLHPIITVGLEIEPDTISIINPGDTAVLPVRVRNIGNERDSFSLSVVYMGSWETYLRRDKIYGDSIVFPINSGERLEFELVVIPPAGTGSSIIGQELQPISDLFPLNAVSIKDSTIHGVVVDTVVVVPELNVHNYPNPFIKETDFFYLLPEDGYVTLDIYNRNGEFVTTLIEHVLHKAGRHFYSRDDNNGVFWNRTNYKGELLSDGIYFYILTFEPINSTHKIRKVIKKAVAGGN